MLVFSAVVFLLLVAALLFLLPPLLKGNSSRSVIERKDLNILLFKDHLVELESDLKNGTITQEQFQQAHADLERSLLQDVSGDAGQQLESKSNVGKFSAVFLAILVPVAAIGLYAYLGTGKLGFNPATAQPDAVAKGHNGTLEEQVVKLKNHLQANPDDVQGWVMLARSYYYLKQYQGASDAFAKTVSIVGETDAGLLADYADALAMASGRTMVGKPFELVKKALSLDPNQQKALWLAATATYEAQDYKTSLDYWLKLRAQFAPESNEFVQMTQNIIEVKQLMGVSIDEEVAVMQKAQAAASVASAETETPATSAAPENAKVSGTVTLDPKLKDKVSASDTLFVFARAASGPRMPLAIIRTSVSDLPLKFTLDDSLAMNPQMKISRFKEVVVGARISKSGNAMPQTGDLSGSSSVVSLGTEGLNISIDGVTP